MPEKPLSPIARPQLAAFIWARDLDLKAVGEAIGCSYEQVRLICLPFGDARRRVPGEALMARIVKWTDGQIRPADFYPPALNTGPASRVPVMAEFEAGE